MWVQLSTIGRRPIARENASIINMETRARKGLHRYCQFTNIITTVIATIPNSAPFGELSCECWDMNVVCAYVCVCVYILCVYVFVRFVCCICAVFCGDVCVCVYSMRCDCGVLKMNGCVVVVSCMSGVIVCTCKVLLIESRFLPEAPTLIMLGTNIQERMLPPMPERIYTIPTLKNPHLLSIMMH